MDTSELESAIRNAFDVAHLEIKDQSSGCGENYSIVLVSDVRVPCIVAQLSVELIMFPSMYLGL